MTAPFRIVRICSEHSFEIQEQPNTFLTMLRRVEEDVSEERTAFGG